MLYRSRPHTPVAGIYHPLTSLTYSPPTIFRRCPGQQKEAQRYARGAEGRAHVHSLGGQRDMHTSWGTQGRAWARVRGRARARGPKDTHTLAEEDRSWLPMLGVSQQQYCSGYHSHTAVVAASSTTLENRAGVSQQEHCCLPISQHLLVCTAAAQAVATTPFLPCLLPVVTMGGARVDRRTWAHARPAHAGGPLRSPNRCTAIPCITHTEVGLCLAHSNRPVQVGTCSGKPFPTWKLAEIRLSTTPSLPLSEEIRNLGGRGGGRRAESGRRSEE